MIQTIIERVACRPGQVDSSAGVLRGVKVLGLVSANGRRYTEDAVRRARALYEGRPVNLDHSPRAGDVRSVVDRIGVIENVAEGNGLSGDLRLLMKHPYASMIVEAGSTMPNALGLSHNVEARGENRQGVFVVEEILEVHSVDLVADPATTKGLYESYLRREQEQALGATCVREAANMFRVITNSARTGLARKATARTERTTEQRQQARLDFLRYGIREQDEPLDPIGGQAPAIDLDGDGDVEPYEQAAAIVGGILDQLAAGTRISATDAGKLRKVLALLQREADRTAPEVEESRRVMRNVATKLLTGQAVTTADMYSGSAGRLRFLRSRTTSHGF